MKTKNHNTFLLYITAVLAVTLTSCIFSKDYKIKMAMQEYTKFAIALQNTSFDWEYREAIMDAFKEEAIPISDWIGIGYDTEDDDLSREEKKIYKQLIKAVEKVETPEIGELSNMGKGTNENHGKYVQYKAPITNYDGWYVTVKYYADNYVKLVDISKK
jgi:hypothetical protein